jgi:hypothetical protein
MNFELNKEIEGIKQILRTINVEIAPQHGAISEEITKIESKIEISKLSPYQCDSDMMSYFAENFLNS